MANVPSFGLCPFHRELNHEISEHVLLAHLSACKGPQLSAQRRPNRLVGERIRVTRWVVAARMSQTATRAFS